MTRREASRTKGMRPERWEVGSLSVGLHSHTQMQVLSCQWNSLDTLQETFIVLYKVFPPNNNRGVLRGGGRGPIY